MNAKSNLSPSKVDPIKAVWDLVDQFTKNPQYVYLSHDSSIDRAALEIGDYVKEAAVGNMYLPKLPPNKSEKDSAIQSIMFELICDAVNYQFWCGKGDVRPNGANAFAMRAILEDVFNHHYPNYESIIEVFKSNLVAARYPNIQSRMRHLDELLVRNFVVTEPYECSICSTLPVSVDFAHFLYSYITKTNEIYQDWKLPDIMRYMICCFPGYGEDMFLKRTFLFFQELYRAKGWFKDEIHLVPIPADYHLPRLLRWKGCMNYSDYTLNHIEGSRLIPDGSIQEYEIRATALLASKKLAEKIGCKMCDIDTYLFSIKGQCKDPIHLTVTSNY